MSRLAALADRPDDERLAAAHVAGRENLVDRCPVALGVGLDIAAPVERELERLDHAFVHRMDEARRKQHKVGRDLEFGARDRLELGIAAHTAQSLDAAALANELLAQHREVALDALLVA